MFGAVFFWMLYASDPHQDLVQRQKYLDAGLAIKDRAERLESPAAIAQYAILLTEFYSKQVGFRTFFLKNLLPGQRLSHSRGSHEQISREETGILVEKNLELLLLNARKKFPDDFRIEFATAQYLVRGRCCYLKPKIQHSPRQVLEIFREARERGLVSSTSLWLLAVDAMGREPVEGALVSSLIERSVGLNPYHEDAVFAYGNDLLKNGHASLALDQAKNLFEMTLDPEMKANAMGVAARAYLALNRCADALKAVETALKFLPNHAPSWMVGLDCLRRTGDQDAYRRLVFDFLGVAPEDPAPFQIYLGYLDLKGFSKLDDFVVAEYEKERDESDLARLTRSLNLGKLYLAGKQWSRAEDHFTDALAIAGEMDDPPGQIKNILDRLIQLARDRR